MKYALALWLAGLLGRPAPVAAHQLDEYLQAATLSLAPGHLTLHLRLTPGTAVARQVLARLDANHDGRLSAAEQRVYAAQVRHYLVLTLNGRALPLQLVAATFPLAKALATGLANIQLQLSARVPPGPATHHLTLTNHHQPAIAAYQVGCLQPASASLRITRQTRNATQSVYGLVFTQRV